MTESPAFTPTIGRKLWLFISPDERRTDWRNVVVLDHTQPMDASVAFVHPIKPGNSYTYVTVTFADHGGNLHAGKVVPLRQPGQAHPNAREWVEWMPYQQGQAAKDAANDGIVLQPAHPVATQRDQLECALVSGAAIHLAHSPHEATSIAKGIKTLLDTLHPCGNPLAVAPAAVPAATTIAPSGTTVLSNGWGGLSSSLMEAGHAPSMPT